MADRRRAVARLLAAGKRVTDVAAEVRIARQTISRWKRDPAFGALLEREHVEQSRALAHSSGRTSASGGGRKRVLPPWLRNA